MTISTSEHVSFSQLVFSTAGMSVVCAQCFSQRTFNIHSTPLASRQRLTKNTFQYRYQIVLLNQRMQSMMPQMWALKFELERFSSNFTSPSHLMLPYFSRKTWHKNSYLTQVIIHILEISWNNLLPWKEAGKHLLGQMFKMLLSLPHSYFLLMKTTF